ncbi:MAG: sterol desaturase family protein [Deltaproteobacteria bacterium]|nr:MAG: sterol desaturase family protein [Deltaproteobacteria bacterium]
MINLIALAIPVFFALIGLEVLVARWQGRPDYLRFNDAISAISCGVGSQVAKVFTGIVGLVLYTGLYHLSEPIWSVVYPFEPMSPWSWLIAMLLVDHQYYWWHRHSHRVNFLWAAHVVHHQSQEYNLAVALRQALFTNLTSLPYYLPLAVLGIHPVVFLISGALNTLYQFWIHTRTVGKLGPLEWVLNTPSHHRVHHGINPAYIDKNHAGILIIWDRLFGTFVEETEEPVYGTVDVLESFDPVWANFHYWSRMWQMARRAERWQDRVWVLFAPPEWSPEGTKEIPEVDASTFQKWDVPLAAGVVWYVLGQFALVGTGGVVWLLLMEDHASYLWLALLGGSVLWATWSWAQLFHRRRVGVVSEGLRHLTVPVVVGALMVESAFQVPAVLAAALVSGLGLALVISYRQAWSTQTPVAAAATEIAAAR